jgi:hypothetical protein
MGTACQANGLQLPGAERGTKAAPTDGRESQWIQLGAPRGSLSAWQGLKAFERLHGA